MNEITQASVESKILTIRGVQVMLDKDLALFYEVTPIRLREQVKRNANRFPADFVFQLSEEEVRLLVSQNAIPSKKSLGGFLPFVFTEQGVAAVSGILKSDKAAIISIQIMRAFVAMRKTIGHLHGLLQRLDQLELKQVKTDLTLEKILKALEKDESPRQGIFFEGQLFDAHVFVSSLIKKANQSLVLVDNYINENTLLLLSKRKANVTCTIHTHLHPVLKSDIKKHNQQYTEIIIVENKRSHDRFLLIDQKELYHFGASLKDLGNKCFAFSRMDKLLPELIQKLLFHHRDQTE